MDTHTSCRSPKSRCRRTTVVLLWLHTSHVCMFPSDAARTTPPTEYSHQGSIGFYPWVHISEGIAMLEARNIRRPTLGGNNKSFRILKSIKPKVNSRAAAAFYVREHCCRVGLSQTRAMRSVNELKLTSKWPSMRRRFWNSTRPCTTNVSPITLSGVCIVMLELSLVIITLGAAVVVTTTGVGSCTYVIKSRPQEWGTYRRITTSKKATYRDRANADAAVRRLASICLSFRCPKGGEF